MKQQITIGLVYDMVILRKGLIGLLQGYEHIQVVFEHAYDEALASAMNANKPDIVLCHAEDQRNILTLQKIKRRHPEVKLIMYISEPTDRTVLELLRSGAKAILTNHSTIENVVEAIEAVYDKGFLYTREIIQMVDRQLTKLLKSNSSIELRLSKREREVLQLLSLGYTGMEIANNLFISKRTLEGYCHRLMKKTGCKNTVELTKWATTYY